MIRQSSGIRAAKGCWHIAGREGKEGGSGGI